MSRKGKHKYEMRKLVIGNNLEIVYFPIWWDNIKKKYVKLMDIKLGKECFKFNPKETTKIVSFFKNEKRK